MRLPAVHKEVPLLLRLGAGVGRVTGKISVPDVIFVMTHRKELFGEPFSAWLQELLRGESTWRVAERELFASFTASRLHCVF